MGSNTTKLRLSRTLGMVLALAACGPDKTPQTDAGVVCKAPLVLRYEQPGCGSQAVARCGPTEQDGCLAYRCTCKGKVTIGCDYTDEPFARTLPYSSDLRTDQDCDVMGGDSSD